VTRWTAALAILVLTACFDPTYRAGAVCSEMSTCPPGQTCSNGLCALTSGPGPADAAEVVDAVEVADAADVDGAEVADAADVDAAEPDGSPDALVDAAVDAPVDALVDAGGGPGCGNLVPVLAGPSPAVLSSGELDDNPIYAAWQAFDDSLRTMWISPSYTSEVIIGYQWSDGPRAAVAYAIHYTNGDITSRAPRDWTVQGHDGKIWSSLVRVTDQRNWLGNDRRVYPLPATQAYAAYRLVITQDNDESSGSPIVAISMGRLELLGAACP
jgi:hypothetical protein